MPEMNRPETGSRSEVDRAVASVRRAIGRLVQLLGHEDTAVVLAAASALEALGPADVVGALATALPRATGPRHRAAIVGALFAFRGQEKAAVLRALAAARARESVPELAIRIGATLSAVIGADLFPRADVMRCTGSGDGSRTGESDDLGNEIMAGGDRRSIDASSGTLPLRIDGDRPPRYS
jgi:hypothetical protein